MNPNEWIGKTHEFELQLKPEVIQRFVDMLGGGGYAVEKGDKLVPWGHWLYQLDNNTPTETFFPETKPHSFYWHSGKIVLSKPLHLGDSCTCKTRVKKADEVAAESPAHLIGIEHRVVTKGRTAIQEEQNLLLTDQIASHEDVRRIDFDPDWQQEVKPEQLNSVQNLRGNLFGTPVTDIFTKSGQSRENSLDVFGPPALILLLESFRYHFVSRVVDRASYKAYGYSGDDRLSIAGEDSDAFVTSLRIINSSRQVLFGTEIRWSYNW